MDISEIMSRLDDIEAKIDKLAEMIEAKTTRLNMVSEDENLSELIDKKRVKDMQREIKILEKEKSKMEKMYEKMGAKKKEIVDEEKKDDEMNEGGEVLSGLAQKLKVEVDRLSEVTLWLGSKMLEGELVDASAGATPYLKMFGQVLGGYYMGKAAILATKKLEETGDEYYKEKITLSKFYIEQLLPLASGYASSVTAGKDDLFNIKAENF